MRKYMIAAGVAALAMGTTAQAATVCKQDNTGRTVATIAGAGIGAILGRVIDGGRHKEVGTIGGAIAGGIAGNQLAKDDRPRCDVAYGYYDESGRWHANRIDASSARGYYDRNNNWVEGPPNGYYDRNNNWVSFNGESQYSGYRDRDGRWVPIGVTGYYAADGQWVQASAPGYYDTRGRWVAGPVYGSYDANGRWIPGSASGGTPTGYWEARRVAGYYDANGRWVRGEVVGYYDARGRWVTTGAVDRPQNVAYGRNLDVDTRQARIAERIDRQRERGLISSSEARRARNELASIRRDESRMRASGGRFTANEESVIQQRLDRLTQQLRADREDGDRYPG
ncbi:glycine zipper 2TM domain-containing protein [Rhizorhabdus dicambivorans]|uniref:17 kDa surface antigen n=1 Tax=Rhizorhabdus dicambivorans TaxID=1850238 RepID=A0A2A4FMK9_9SPHN|nr:glycine zipper 2TM domain-containing protein [Rhizorhabdus dicambivorans]ATE66485.1 glycine zipper 2TM domain-containing protein [Rhizorhabdus dicambivorans]PCE39633.1 glycine zipper 2TM domain-containing protein [Rhizorhabdus dicambivorans]